MIYVIHFIIVLILFLIFGREKANKNYFYITTFIYVIFIFGQRWMTGTDFSYYLLYYINDFTKSEWAYFGLQNIFKNWNLYFGLLIFLVFFITEFNFYKFFSRFKNKNFLLFLFLISSIFFAQMSQIRQYVAISFFINSLYFSYKKDYKKSIFNFIFATGFHGSSIYFLPLLFLKPKISRNTTLGIFIISLFLPIINIGKVFTLPIFNNFSNYVGSAFDVPLGFAHYILYYSTLIILLYFVYNVKGFQKSDLSRFIINGTIIFIVLYGLSFKFAPLYRISTYYQVFQILFLVHYHTSFVQNPTSVIKGLIYTFFIGILVFNGISDSANISNYQFRLLRIKENRSTYELINEANKAHKNNLISLEGDTYGDTTYT